MTSATLGLTYKIVHMRRYQRLSAFALTYNQHALSKETRKIYIQYPRPVVDCAPNVTADRPAHWSAQSKAPLQHKTGLECVSCRRHCFLSPAVGGLSCSQITEEIYLELLKKWQ